MDVWGRIFRDHWVGHVEPHFIERDDGREETFESAAIYFEAPRSEAEKELLGRLDGPVLDLGAGGGSYTVYLQNQGLQVTAADSSPLAVEVCRRQSPFPSYYPFCAEVLDRMVGCFASWLTLSIRRMKPISSIIRGIESAGCLRV